VIVGALDHDLLPLSAGRRAERGATFQPQAGRAR
jgi:hypothetical protein